MQKTDAPAPVSATANKVRLEGLIGLRSKVSFRG
jgi:hypothetical protein